MTKYISKFLFFVNYFLGNMASVRKKGKYTADDLLDEFILRKVAQHVYHSSVKEFAKNLDVSQTDHERTTVSSGLSIKQQIYEVKRENPLQNYLSFVDETILPLVNHIIPKDTSTLLM